MDGAFEPITTQEELDARLKSRIDRLNRKHAAEMEAKQAELDAALAKAKAGEDGVADLKAELEREQHVAEIAAIRREVAGAHDVPEALLTGDDRETIESQAAAFAEWAKERSKATAPVVGTAGQFARDASGADPKLTFANRLAQAGR